MIITGSVAVKSGSAAAGNAGPFAEGGAVFWPKTNFSIGQSVYVKGMRYTLREGENDDLLTTLRTLSALDQVELEEF